MGNDVWTLTTQNTMGEGLDCFCACGGSGVTGGAFGGQCCWPGVHARMVSIDELHPSFIIISSKLFEGQFGESIEL